MGHGNRTTRRDLFTEQRNHAAVTAQHVTEPDRHKFRLIMLVKGLYDHLTDPFAGSHDVRRIYRLVGGDHDKSLYTAHGSCLRGLKGTEHVILDRLGRTVLHKRYMLMRRGMVYDIGPVFRENIIHAVSIAHGCNQYHQIQLRIFRLQFLLYIINRIIAI